MTPWKNRLIFSDNLEALRNPTFVQPESVDLVYLDPPFNSNRTYSAFFEEKDGKKAAAQIQAFTDSWTWDTAAVDAFRAAHHIDEKLAKTLDGLETILGHCDMLAYIAIMAPRLHAIRTVMKPTASIYLHCDSTASHYLRLLMDAIFYPENFRNEIIWQRTWSNVAKRYGPVHDTILFYSRTDDYIWNGATIEQNPNYIEQAFKSKDDDGRRYQVITLTGPGTTKGDSGKPWRGVDPTISGRHWAINQRALAQCGITGGTVQERLDALDVAGRIEWPDKKNGIPRLKWYLDELEGKPAPDIWTDIGHLSSQSTEALGYPTQKPIALLERIIKASSKPGDLFMDPFCGCGTAIDAAQALGRRWIGIDITHVAMGIIKHRLEGRYGPDVRGTYEVFGIPKTVEEAHALAAEDKFKFQDWALTFLTGARPNAEGAKRGADRGKDGTRILDLPNGKFLRVLIQVKGGHIERNVVSTLLGDMSNQHYQMGVVVSLMSPTRQMRMEAMDAGEWIPDDPLGSGVEHFPKIQLVTVAELLDGKRLAFPDYHESTVPRPTPAPKPIKRTRDLGEFSTP